MHGLMQDQPLSLPFLMERIENQYARRKITTYQLGYTTTTTYGQLAQRIRKAAAVLDLLQVPEGARVGTFGWNTQRHLELYMSVSCSKRVLHTINHRLFEDQLGYMIDDAEDDVIFVDRSIFGEVWPVLRDRPSVRNIIVVDDGDSQFLPDDPRILDYESLMERVEPNDVEFKPVDDRLAAALCYTSGTTGRPKGVLYDHRSIVLHALMLLTMDSFAIRNSDVILPIVPMFHVNAWGLPYAAMMCGADLVMPGPLTRPDQLTEMMENHKVTFGAAVATVWNSMLPFLEGRDWSRVRMLMCGGGAVPLSLTKAYKKHVGVPLSNAWGMTETSPVVTGARTDIAENHPADSDEDLALLSSTGAALPLTQMRIVSDDGQILANDGKSTGELQVSGPTVAASYYGKNEASTSFTEDGWLRTGDIAVIDDLGNLQVVDRVKDLVKSGGEWISSVQLEHAILENPQVAEAAVVAISDEQWGERPLAVVVPVEGEKLSSSDVTDHLLERVAKWWVPEHVVIVNELPKTGTGKVSKLHLRERAADLLVAAENL